MYIRLYKIQACKFVHRQKRTFDKPFYNFSSLRGNYTYMWFTTSLTFVVSLVIFLTACQNTSSNNSEVIDTQDSTALYFKSPKQQDGIGNKVVFICGDEEYRSEEGMPMMAKIFSEYHGFNCTVLFSQDSNHLGIINPNYHYNIPNLEEINDADLIILFTRFRALPNDQMELINNYLLEGKPIIGIRTATHAFEFKDTLNNWYHYSNSFSDPDSPWNGGFGRFVLGENWVAHHGHHKHQSTRGILADKAENHPITRGIKDGDIWGPTDVYRVRLPMPEEAQALILGQVVDREGNFDEHDPFYGLRSSDDQLAKENTGSAEAYDPNNPKMPIAWTKPYQIPDGEVGQSFTSTIGSSTDLLNEGVRRLLINATYYLLDLAVPEHAEVTLPTTYNPTAYGFHTDQYWVEKKALITDIN